MTDIECKKVIGFIDFDEGKCIIVPETPKVVCKFNKPKSEDVEVLVDITNHQYDYEYIENLIKNGYDNKDGNYKCQICFKEFLRKDYWKRHVYSHNNKFKCNICNKCFMHENHLKQHSVSHNERKIYKCDICNLTSFFNFNIKKHKKTHIMYYDNETNTHKYL
jgi:hypothetical protein